MAELKQCNEGDLEISSQLEIYPPPQKKKSLLFMALQRFVSSPNQIMTIAYSHGPYSGLLVF